MAADIDSAESTAYLHLAREIVQGPDSLGLTRTWRLPLKTPIFQAIPGVRHAWRAFALNRAHTMAFAANVTELTKVSPVGRSLGDRPTPQGYPGPGDNGISGGRRGRQPRHHCT